MALPVIGGRDLTNGAGNADVYAAALPQTNSAGSQTVLQ